MRTQRELATLGYFDPETIDIQPQPNLNDGTVDIRFGLTEKSSDELQLSAGLGGNLGFIGTVGLAFNNFSARKMTDLKNLTFPPTGDGQKLSLKSASERTTLSKICGFFFRTLDGRSQTQ